MPETTLQFESLSKSFPGVRALREVSFGVPLGCIRALVGENGAGKSTLLKLLAGVYAPDGGRILLHSRARAFHSIADSMAAGIAVIHQELNLVPEMSVAENLFLGHWPARYGWLDRKKLRDSALRQLADLGESIDPGAKVKDLSLAQRQMVEIAKALSRDAQIIAFDEPTSSLSFREVDRLFKVIRGLKRQGKAILYVSHRMEEIFKLCDSATVLRDGRHVETFASLKKVGRETLISRMVGRSLEGIFHYQRRAHGPAALEVGGLMGPGLAAPVSFQVAQGEILGFFGLVGAGRTELLKLIYGAVKAPAGKLKVKGIAVKVRGPRQAIRSGIVLCPEDRKKEGIIPLASVMDNINLSSRRRFSRWGFFLRKAEETNNARRFWRQLAIKTPSLSTPVMNLSGGNQQKAILGRWLSEEVKVILLDEPTRGIDVGAKSEIYAIIQRLAKQGMGVVLVSSELPEVLGVCDRVLVMRQGRLAGSFSRFQATEKKLLKAALPVVASEEAVQAA